jgi:regulator of RNase E activity RraA
LDFINKNHLKLSNSGGFIMSLLTVAQIEEIRNFDVPTISNALERFNLRSKVEGYMTPSIKQVIFYERTMIGYACTAKISTAKPATPEQQELWMKYYTKVQSTPRPSIAVLEDVDPTPVGSFWGEVNATTHKALGCVGTITNGGVRDLKEVEALGFGFYASCVLVGHGYTHIEDIDCPVTIGGVTVNPGDLLAADRHGVVLIPNQVAGELADACRKIAAAELPVLEGCRRALLEGKEVNLDELKQWRAEMARLRTAK